MSNNLILLINERISKMSKSHKLIGRFIIDHSDKAMNLTATRLGEEIGVSESTVVRFAIELGFRGYPELQKALRNHIKTKLTSVHRIDASDTALGKDVLRDVIQRILKISKPHLSLLTEMFLKIPLKLY